VGGNSDVLELPLLLHKGLAPTLCNFTIYQIREMKHFALISISLECLSTKSFVCTVLNNILDRKQEVMISKMNVRLAHIVRLNTCFKIHSINEMNI
jgi:hypothetical protein